MQVLYYMQYKEGETETIAKWLLYILYNTINR
jgi:hypothetical protein